MRGVELYELRDNLFQACESGNIDLQLGESCEMPATHCTSHHVFCNSRYFFSYRRNVYHFTMLYICMVCVHVVYVVHV